LNPGMMKARAVLRPDPAPPFSSSAGLRASHCVRKRVQACRNGRPGHPETSVHWQKTSPPDQYGRGRRVCYSDVGAVGCWNSRRIRTEPGLLPLYHPFKQGPVGAEDQPPESRHGYERRGGNQPEPMHGCFHGTYLLMPMHGCFHWVNLPPA